MHVWKINSIYNGPNLSESISGICLTLNNLFFVDSRSSYKFSNELSIKTSYKLLSVDIF